MIRKLSALLMGATICATGLMAARAQDTKKTEKSEIAGGIVGKVTKIDTEKDTLTVETEDGKPRTFTVTDETHMLGPRGGKVRRRLKDPRFLDGRETTVVATGSTAKELHLGASIRGSGAGGTTPKPAATKKMTRRQREELESELAKSTKGAPSKVEEAVSKKIVAADDDDDDDEYPGKVKTYVSNGGRHQLVVSLLNGKSGSYLLSKEVKVFVKGKPSADGLEDSALKEGTPITVFTEAGGHKVKELHLEPATAASKAASKLKKAG